MMGFCQNTYFIYHKLISITSTIINIADVFTNFKSTLNLKPTILKTMLSLLSPCYTVLVLLRIVL